MDLWLEALRTGWHAIVSHRLRTLLTAVTVALGAAAIACLLSLSSSVFATILSGVEAVGGHRMIFLTPRQPKLAKSRPTDGHITLDDANMLRERVPGLDRLAYLMTKRDVVLQGNGRKANVGHRDWLVVFQLPAPRGALGSRSGPGGCNEAARARALRADCQEALRCT